MNYFAYQSNTSGSVWGLFRELGETSLEQKEKMYAGSEYAHTLEIVSAALSGAIATDPESVENFNLRLYEAKCVETDALGRRERCKKVLNIVETTGDETLQPGYGEISDRSLAADDDELSALEDNIAFNENLQKLLNIRSKYICERGVDVVSVLYSALKGIPEAVGEMKALVKDSAIGDLYKQLCEDSRDGALLKRLEVAV